MNTFQKLENLIETNKSIRKYLVQKLNYKDVSSGTNKLLTQLRNKTITNDRLKLICEILDYNNISEVINDYLVMKETIKKENELLEQISLLKYQIKIRDEFKPYIYIMTEKYKPDSIVIASFIGNKTKYIRDLPNYILDLSKNEQIKIVKNIVINNFIENKGICLLYGKITGYIFYRSFNEKIYLSQDGEIIDKAKEIA